MSILHDSLERHRRETASEAGSSVAWILDASPPSSGARQDIFTRRTLVLLGVLVLFSLGVWGIVQLWPLSGEGETVTAPLSVSQGGSVGIRAPLVQPEAVGRGPATGPEVAGRAVEVRSSDAPPRSFSTRSGDVSTPSGATQTHLAPRQSSSAPEESRNLAGTSEISSTPALDPRTLEELNLRLSTLLAALPRSFTGQDGGPSDSLTERSLDGTDDATDHALRHVSDHLHQGEPLPMEDHASDMDKAASPPMVQVSVFQPTEPSQLMGIRPLEEELGRALRARDWEAFELASNRLADLQPGDALVRWRAARAMALADYEGARTLLEPLHRDNPLDLRTGLNLALVHEAQGEIETARNIARSLARRHPLDSGLQDLLDRLENRRIR